MLVMHFKNVFMSIICIFNIFFFLFIHLLKFCRFTINLDNYITLWVINDYISSPKLRKNEMVVVTVFKH